MKKLKISLVVACMFSMNLFSQSMYNNQGSSMSNQTQNNEPTKEQIEKAREESLDKVMTQLTSDLTLDALQVVAIRQIYTESIKKQGVILKKEDSNESKSEQLKFLSESTEKKVLALLNPQQKEKYELLKNDVSSGKKKEKKKKKKKEKQE